MNSLRVGRAASYWYTFRASILLCVALLTASHVAQAQYSQQAYLVGSDAVGPSGQGQFASALSADGNAALVGGPGDNNGTGAAWVFVRSGTTWTQQGPKLVGTGSNTNSNQGFSVGLSADGNTAIVGGTDGSWIFARSGSTWTQQASLGGGGGVALSGDGNTAIAGNPGDSNGIGSAWIYTRSGTTWTLQGPKLVANDYFIGSPPSLGFSVALSGDGNTAIVGGPSDYGPNGEYTLGGVWIFTRSGSTWTQQGSKLLPDDYTAHSSGYGPQIGTSVAISADGNTVTAGAPYDGANGAAWAFTRSGGVWTQQGPKIVDIRTATDGYQGFSVALSGDGNTMMLGIGSGTLGAPASPFFVRNSGMWCKLGTTNVSGLGENVALSADGGTALSVHYVFVRGAGRFPSTPATHDFNCDGKSDVLWNDQNGNSAVWLLDGGQVTQSAPIGNTSTWSVWGQRDFNGDGKSDILWQDVSGDIAIWFMNGTQVLSSAGLGNMPSSTWTIVGTGDFDNDGKGDILWRNTSGAIAIWFMNGGQVSASASLGAVPGNWLIYGTGDFDGDGKSDILWRDSNAGTVAIWFMNGGRISSTAAVATIGSSWTIEGLNAD